VPALSRALDVCFERMGFFGLSLWGDNGLMFEEVCRLARLRNPRVRVSTVGRLRVLGLDPHRSGRYPHLTIKFVTRPSGGELVALIDAFGPPISNPYPAGLQ
jgi:hypothetical protein